MDSPLIPNSRYRDIVEDLTDLVCRYDTEWRITFANSAYCEAYGLPNDKIIGMSFFDKIPLEEHDAVRTYLHSLNQNNPLSTSIHRTIMVTGEIRWFEWRDRVLLNEAGDVVEYQAIGRDITDQQEAKLALEELNRTLEARVAQRTADLLWISQRLMLATQASRIGVWDLNLQTGELIWDRRMYELYGASATIPSTEVWFSVIHPDDRDRVVNEIVALTEMTGIYETEFRVMLPNGTLRYIHGNGVVERDEQNNPVRAVGTNMDVTDTKIAEDMLRLSLERERELSDLKTHFITMSSHEFRTPLATILTGTDILARYRERLSETQIDERLQKIREQVMHMKDMLEKVLQVAQLQAGNGLFHPQKTDFTAFCQTVIDDFASNDVYQGRIMLDLPPHPIRFAYDEALMRQIVTNLIANGLLYSASDQQVTVKLHENTHQVVLTVSDVGMGIPEVDQKYIFEPFHRGSNVNNIMGAGLGLSIVKQAVDFHRGKITVTSEEHKGTVVRVIFPKEAN
jgi:hypothetical protein